MLHLWRAIARDARASKAAGILNDLHYKCGMRFNPRRCVIDVRSKSWQVMSESSFDREMNSLAERLGKFGLQRSRGSSTSSVEEQINRVVELKQQRQQRRKWKRRNKRKRRRPQKRSVELQQQQHDGDDQLLVAKASVEAEAHEKTERIFALASIELKQLAESFFFYEICCKESHGALRALPRCRDIDSMARRYVERWMPSEANERWSRRRMRKTLSMAYTRYISCLRYHRLR